MKGKRERGRGKSERRRGREGKNEKRGETWMENVRGR